MQVSSPATPLLRRGAYDLLTVIGEGAYGTVWQARKEDRLYAVKEEPCDTEGVRSPTELDILFRYDHPNLTKGIEFFFATSTVRRDDNPDNISTFLVMELAELDLKAYIDRNSIEENQRFRLCYELASALSVLHSSGFYHCDVKPTNCLITNHSLKLGDFGLVRYKRVKTSLCQSSPAAAPEVLGTHRSVYGLRRKDFPAGNDDIFFQTPNPVTTEIWALGVTFGYILTGDYLFGEGSSVVVINIATYRSNPIAYLERNGVKAEWQPLFLQLLALSTATRTKSVDNVLQGDLFARRGYAMPIQGLVKWNYQANVQCDATVTAVVNWLFEVFDAYSVEQGVIFGTLSLLYAVYEPVLQRIGRRRYQLLGVACVLLATKLYASNLLEWSGVKRSVEELVSLTASTVTEADIRQTERQVIEALSGMLFFPTYYTRAFSRQALEKCLPIVRDCQKFISTDPALYMTQLEMTETPEEREARIPL